MVRRILGAFASLLFFNPIFIVRLLYGNIWELRKKCIKNHSKILETLYYSYLDYYGSWIGLNAKINTPPIFPHGLHGVFISDSAVLGDNIVIFQQVTIGSNMIKGSNRFGSPTIEDNVYIGAGAKIIGKVFVGHNSRIGANCVVVKDIPSNSVVIIKGIETIQKNEPLDNTYYPNHLNIH